MIKECWGAVSVWKRGGVRKCRDILRYVVDGFNSL